MKLAGKVAIVTGGGTGIGRAIAERFAAEGASLMIAQRRADKAEEAAAEIRANGALAASMGIDIRSRGQVEELVRRTIAIYGRLDILVNNAGITGMAAISPFLESSEEFVDDIVDVNLKGTIYCSQEAARAMAAREGGVIIHISSVAAVAAQEGASIYCASKAALSGLTRAMALELSPLGIRVNCLLPGDIMIETNQAIAEEMKQQNVSGKYFRRIPAGRRGRPDEVAGAAVFLASDDATYIQGATLVVDGGFLIY